MKQTTLFSGARTLLLTLAANLLAFWAFAQDNGDAASVKVSTSGTSTTTSSNWYAAPWVWIVGAAVFILLLVALLNNRGSNKSDT